MAKHDELIIEPRDAGGWSIKKPHAERASAVERTRAKAVNRAKELAPEGDIKAKNSRGRFTYVQKGKKPR